MHPGEQHDENDGDQIEHDDESNDDNSSVINDSITLLKQTVAAATEKSTDKGNSKDNPSTL